MIVQIAPLSSSPEFASLMSKTVTPGVQPYGGEGSEGGREMGTVEND